jgi:hypothetical protein
MKAACLSVYAAEVAWEEVLKGGEMRQIVSDAHHRMCGMPTEDAVARAELTRWHLKGILKVNLADDERRYIILRLVMNHESC